jgi:hypothetical protein
MGDRLAETAPAPSAGDEGHTGRGRVCHHARSTDCDSRNCGVAKV